MRALFREITKYELGVQELYLHDWAEGTELYKRAGETSDPAVMADHDGPVLLGEDREFRRLERDDSGVITAYHPHGGRMDFFDGTEDRQAILLQGVEKADV